MSVSQAAAQAPGLPPPPTNLPTTPLAAHQATYFFKNSAFEFVFLTSLGRAYHQGGNVGKVLYSPGRSRTATSIAPTGA